MSILPLTYQESVFKRYHSDKHVSEFYVQDGGKNHRYGTKLRHCHPVYTVTVTLYGIGHFADMSSCIRSSPTLQ